MAKFKIFIIGTYGMKNLGDEALLTCLLRDLNSRFNSPEIVISSFNKKYTEQYHTDFKFKAIDNERFSLFPIKTIKSLIKSNLTIVCGSTPFTDIISGKWVYFFLYRILLAKLFGNKVELWNVEVGPLKRPKLRKRICYVLNLADKISVRNSESLTELKELGATKTEITLSQDSALNLNNISDKEAYTILKKNKISLKKPLICICLRDWYMFPVKTNIFTRKHKFLWQDNGMKKWKSLKTKLAKLSDKIIEETNSQLLFVNMRYEENIDEFGSYRGDNHFTNEVIALMRNKGKAKVLKAPHRAEAIKSVLGKSGLVISMRLHALIFAIANNVPCLGFDLEPKIKRFLYSVNKQKSLISIDDNIDNIINVIKKIS